MAERVDAERAVPPERCQGNETEFKLALRDEAELEAFLSGLRSAAAGSLAAASGDPTAPWPPPGVQQVNHFFDTPTGRLGAARLGLRLREEAGRWRLTAKGPASSGAAAEVLSSRPELELELGEDAAAQLLAGQQCPFRYLRERAPNEPLVERLAQTLADEPLRYLGSFRNERCRIGPVAIHPEGAASGADRASAGCPPLVFELDRTEFPGGRVDREVEVELAAEDAPAAEVVLRALWNSAGLAWRSAPSKAARFLAALASSAPAPEE